MKTPRTRTPTAAEWLDRIKAATLLQSLSLDIGPEPWLRQLCSDVLRASHGTSPEFEAAALSWLTPTPPTLSVGVFLSNNGSQGLKSPFLAGLVYLFRHGRQRRQLLSPLVMFPDATPTRTPAARFFGKTYGEPSAALLALCQAALVARAETETVRPVILAIQVQVLSEGDFQVASQWKEHGVPVGRILDPAGAYEMTEERFMEYYTACAAKYRAAGFAFPDQQCPLAIAEDVQAQAEKAFGLACSELRTGIDPQKALEHGNTWKPFLELLFGIVVPFLTPHLPAQGSTSFRASRF